MNYINPNEFGGLLFDQNEISAVSHVLQTGKIFRYADEVKRSISDEAEAKFSLFFKTKYAILINNGTSALKCALRAIDIKPGDRVLISAFTFIATAEAVISMGGIPIPIELDLNYCMNIENLSKEIQKGCIAVIAVHLQGRAFNLEPIKILTKNHSICLIEDACQAFGSKYKDTYSGCFGDIGVFSFQQNKQITSGEAGLVITNKVSFREIARNYMDHGCVRSNKPNWDSKKAIIGENCRITNLQSAILTIQLDKFPYIKTQQRKIRDIILHRIHSENIKALYNSADPLGDTGMNIMFLIKNREIADHIISYSMKHSVLFKRLWSKPYFNYKVFQLIDNYKKTTIHNNCKFAFEVASRLLVLPIPPTLKSNNLNKIVTTINHLSKMNLIS